VSTRAHFASLHTSFQHCTLSELLDHYMTDSIYLDHAAATPLAPEVRDAMMPYFSETFGNPSSVHAKGQEARRAVDMARRTTGEILGCDPREIIFTGSGTESDNLAIQGVCRAYEHVFREQNKKPHIVTSRAEHSAVLNTIEYFEKNYDFDVTYVGVDEFGIVNPEDVRNALREETILCSIMYANNEVGSINDVTSIGEICRTHAATQKNSEFPGVLFHTDACQAGGALPLSVEELHVDLMTINGSKIYGPKGVGALYRRKGIKLVPMIFGGEGQEHRLRAGTENVAAIVGFAKALELAEEFRKRGPEAMQELRDYLTEEILEKIPDSFLNGPIERLPNNVNISFKGIDGAALLMQLDLHGIHAASGSACTSGSLEPSHVLLAMGRNEELATSALRLTLGRNTSQTEIDRVIEILMESVKKLRKDSPIY